jgi:4-alpha-glucanotransferase
MSLRFTLHRRSSGILLHLTSLPGPHGSGDLGPASYRFADWLAACKQRWWQMLPVGPIGKGNAPYSSCSAYAGNPYLIDLERLAEEGWLNVADLLPDRSLTSRRVNYPAMKRFRETRLRKAFARFEERATTRKREGFEAFCREARSWLDDYALYCALRNFFGGKSWSGWPPALRDRSPASLADARKKLARAIRYHQFTQYQFYVQWNDLRTYCRKHDIGLIGDVSFYVDYDSADVWAHREMFQLDARGRPTAQAGVPPDYFSRSGQLWRHPLYRWDVLRRRGYDWWIERLRGGLARFDVLRLDHFIGFHRSWAVSPRARTARRGRWRPGPGADFFVAVRRALGGRFPLIAEDLGAVTPEVRALRDQFGLPGMRVLQFAFGNGAEASDHLPENHVRRCVVYPGTHDNDTIIGWLRDRSASRRPEHAPAMRYAGGGVREFHWNIIRLAFGSVADLAIIPLQDVLGLGSRARLNYPGTSRGNWEWRFGENDLTGKIARRLAELTITYQRV